MKNDTPSYERYQRQIILKQFGEAGQQKLQQAKVLVVGAGGLGCPALQYLVAAGVGNIGIVDGDVVSLSNLHRQPLYTTFDIGFSKAEKAKHSLNRLNPEIFITAYNQRLTPQNALTILSAYDIILDATDNFASRYLINDACVMLNKILVFGAVSQFEGQVAVFNCIGKNGTAPVNYRDLFPTPPKDDEVLNCAGAGVLGVLPGIIGTMQANETIKLITGIGNPLINSLLTYNALHNSMYDVLLTAQPGTRQLIPATAHDFEQTDYNWLCASGNQQLQIDAETFNRLRNAPSVQIIDVREAGESPLPAGFNYQQIPLSIFKHNMCNIKSDTIIVFCQTGKRSLQAAQLLADKYSSTKKIFSLQGGLLNWLNTTPTSML
ncbi:MAG: HesA/MoeB/ThiF family protein [Aquabacterium sp.]|nr:HesA/MoeB/ThiF family protein [Ferruginibacter sp.]